MRRQEHKKNHTGFDHRASIHQWLQWMFWGEWKKRVYIELLGLEKEFRCFPVYKIGENHSLSITQTEIPKTTLKTNKLYACMGATNEIS